MNRATRIPFDVEIEKYVAGALVVFDLEKLEIKWAVNILFVLFLSPSPLAPLPLSCSFFFFLTTRIFRPDDGHDRLPSLHVRHAHSG